MASNSNAPAPARSRQSVVLWTVVLILAAIMPIARVVIWNKQSKKSKESPIIENAHLKAGPTPEQVAEVDSLLKPGTTHLPPGFSSQWNWDGLAMRAAQLAKERNLQVGDPALRQSLALVLDGIGSDIPRNHFIPPNSLKFVWEIGPESDGKPRRIRAYSTSSPSGYETRQNVFGAQVVVAKHHGTWGSFINWNTKSPAYDTSSSIDTAEPRFGTTRGWADIQDLKERMFPSRNKDGSRVTSMPSGDSISTVVTAPPGRTASNDLDHAWERAAGRGPLRAVLLFQLHPPFTDASESKGALTAATMSNPNETSGSSSSELHGYPFAVVFFDTKDKRILGRVDLGQPGQIRLKQSTLEEEIRQKMALQTLVKIGSLYRADQLHENTIEGINYDEATLRKGLCELALRYIRGEGLPENLTAAQKVLELVDAGYAHLVAKAREPLRQRLGMSMMPEPPALELGDAYVSAKAAFAAASPRLENKKVEQLRNVEVEKIARLKKEAVKESGAGQYRAQYELGMSYLTGKGVEKSQAKGIQWLRAAAANGHTAAKIKLEDLGVDP